MTSRGDGQNLVYRVVASEQIRADLKQQHFEAIQKGKGVLFLSALRSIWERLCADPLAFGEPFYRLPALNLVICQGAVLPLVVDYAVDEGRRLVFIRGVKALS